MSIISFLNHQFTRSCWKIHKKINYNLQSQCSGSKHRKFFQKTLHQSPQRIPSDTHKLSRSQDRSALWRWWLGGNIVHWEPHTWKVHGTHCTNCTNCTHLKGPPHSVIDMTVIPAAPATPTRPRPPRTPGTRDKSLECSRMFYLSPGTRVPTEPVAARRAKPPETTGKFTGMLIVRVRSAKVKGKAPLNSPQLLNGHVHILLGQTMQKQRRFR